MMKKILLKFTKKTIMRNLKILITLFLSLGLLGAFTEAHAAITDPLTTIELETPVHFLAPDGSDLLVEAGTYAIEPAEEWIRIMSGERHDAVLIEATKSTHELELEHSMGLSVPGETEEESDLHHVTLLLPDGQSLDATGTYSGIRHRGFLKNTINQLKKKTRQTYKKARSTAKKTVSKAKGAVNKAKKHVQRSAKQGMRRAKKGAQTIRNAALHAKRKVERGARISAHEIAMKVMKESIKETNRDKQHFLEKIKKANKKKQQILQKLKDKRLLKQTKDRLKQELKNLEDVNQQLNFELQAAVQRMTQAQQAMSNIMKKFHDAQKAIISNLK